jgi:hypothetical protein
MKLKYLGKAVVLLLTLSVGSAAFSGTANAEPAQVSSEAPAAPEMLLGNQSGSFKIPLKSSRAQKVIEDIAAGREVQPPPGANEPGNPNDPSTNFTVGAGWYFYTYLNHGDIWWLRGLGYTAATAAICVWLTPTVVGGVACAVVAYIIWSVIVALASPFPAGKCLEIKYNWGSFSYAGSKWVTRNC